MIAWTPTAAVPFRFSPAARTANALRDTHAAQAAISQAIATLCTALHTD
ncbi:hypothetical protein OG765_28800 [Streptomyces sp. NBC_00555]|nr:hypothetical protein [Streptomyces sp. NBC_00555]MCX5014947.1 hypothetical protein [Streptomyces sp. NBC_00555]